MPIFFGGGCVGALRAESGIFDDHHAAILNRKGRLPNKTPGSLTRAFCFNRHAPRRVPVDFSSREKLDVCLQCVPALARHTPGELVDGGITGNHSGFIELNLLARKSAEVAQLDVGGHAT